MEKKVLAAVDDSLHSRNAVRYLADMHSVLTDLRITLFGVQPSLSQYLVDEAKGNARIRKEVERLRRRNREKSEAMLAEHRDLLLRSGVPESAVRTETRPRSLGVAKDILTVAQEGLFDALVMGRRGLSKLQEMVMGSVTAGVTENALFIPVWLVDGQVQGKRILAAVDGSENSLRAVDHLAFMMKGSADAEVVFFHMEPKIGDSCNLDLPEAETEDLDRAVLDGDRRCIDQFRRRAAEQLEKAGIAGDRVRWEVKAGWSNIAKAVLDAMGAGGYGTLVVGRRGVQNRYFSGSVSRALLSKMSDAALWLVP